MSAAYCAPCGAEFAKIEDASAHVRMHKQLSALKRFARLQSTTLAMYERGERPGTQKLEALNVARHLAKELGVLP